jgi:hypothetical protein
MIKAIAAFMAKRRMRRLTAALDAKIARARLHHQPVKHLLQAKTDLIHKALGGHNVAG